MILTEIGEIGVHYKGNTVVLRPSLYAMSQLGSPKEILESYAIIMSEFSDSKMRWKQFREALSVINSCCEDDLSDVFGYLNERRKYVKKAAGMSDILAIARSLMQHGITGTQEPIKRKDKESDYVTEFKAQDHVALAMAHLNIPEDKAWAMTMTSLVAALRAKFPQQESKDPGSKAPTKDEHEATMEWFEKVQRKRESVH
ncbi:hypothetical protein M3906_000282 [Vibrio metschnikovii]|nr:hypothetical protein [Vibrio metschnikovii]